MQPLLWLFLAICISAAVLFFWRYGAMRWRWIGGVISVAAIAALTPVLMQWIGDVRITVGLVILAAVVALAVTISLALRTGRAASAGMEGSADTGLVPAGTMMRFVYTTSRRVAQQTAGLALYQQPRKEVALWETESSDVPVLEAVRLFSEESAWAEEMDEPEPSLPEQFEEQTQEDLIELQTGNRLSTALNRRRWDVKSRHRTKERSVAETQDDAPPREGMLDSPSQRVGRERPPLFQQQPPELEILEEDAAEFVTIDPQMASAYLDYPYDTPAQPEEPAFDVPLGIHTQRQDEPGHVEIPIAEEARPERVEQAVRQEPAIRREDDSPPQPKDAQGFRRVEWPQELPSRRHAAQASQVYMDKPSPEPPRRPVEEEPAYQPAEPERPRELAVRNAPNRQGNARMGDAQLMDWAFTLKRHSRWDEAAEAFLLFRNSAKAPWLRKQADIERLGALIAAGRVRDAVDHVFEILDSGYDLTNAERNQVMEILRRLQA